MDALGISPTKNANEFTTVESMSGMSDLSSPLMNLTVDAGNASGASDLYEVPLGLVVLLSFLYGSISVIAVLGNALVIIVIIKNRPMHTVTNFFIANLASADVLIGTFSIPFQFQAAVMQRWDLPAFMCPLAPFVKQVSVTVSITTLAVISIDRYFAVIHPLKPHCSKTKAYIAMGFVWFFSIASSVPMAVVFRFIHVPDADADVPGDTKPFCRPFWPQNHVVDWNKLYSLYLSITQYFFPLIIISFAYFRIMCKIWGNRAPGSAVDCRDRLLNKNKRKVSGLYSVYYDDP